MIHIPERGAYNPSPLLKAVQIFLLILIVIGVVLLFTQKIWVPKLVDAIIQHESLTVQVSPDVSNPPVKDSFDGRNTAFTIDGTTVVLRDGVSETASAPGSASNVVTRYFGNEAVGDLTGDGQPDRAFLFTQETGGSGTFFYAVVALKQGDTYITTNAFLIGDRIAPQSLVIPQNAQELQVNYAERRPGEAMTVAPSQGATLLLKVTPEGILEGLMQ